VKRSIRNDEVMLLTEVSLDSFQALVFLDVQVPDESFDLGPFRAQDRLRFCSLSHVRCRMLVHFELH
jgi:hypothetical protein